MTDTNSPTSTPHEAQVAALNRMVEVSLILNSTLKLEPLLGFIMDATAELTDAEAASILLMDPNTHELRFAATSTGNLVALADIPVPLEGSMAGRILREDRPIARDFIGKNDPNHYSKVGDAVEMKIESLIGVPMRIKDQVIGVLEAMNKSNGRKWTPDDHNRLSILASQAAVAIHNARLIAEQQRLYEELSQVDKLKSDFIAIASHELRTPLGVILGYASFLQEEAQGEASDHAAAVLNSALHLRGLIETMTNLHYLQLSEDDLIREQVPVAAIIQDALDSVTELAQAKKQQLTAEAPAADLWLDVDRSKVTMALSHVLNNAVKFTLEGGQINLTVETKPDEVWLCVADSGIGISAEHLEFIFKEFRQVEDHMTRRHGGMGLGLSLARGLVKVHGGRIWAESDGLDQGTCFKIALPLPTT